METGAVLVLDTNVALDWLVFDDPATRELADAIEAGRVRVVTNDECLAELRRVLTYSNLKLNAETQAGALERYLAHASRSEAPVGERSGLPLCADRDDQKFLELAWHAKADYLLTKDKALLEMTRKVSNFGRFAVISPGQWGRAVR